jgi:biotin carboxyl carrier protein
MALGNKSGELQKKREKAFLGGGEQAIEKQKALGKRTARERIMALLDEDSFNEYDFFVEHDARDFDMDKKDKLKFLNIDSSLYKTRISKKFENRKPYQPVNPRIILSFIPGTVLEILVKEGQTVDKGEVLMILDAMKMQNRLKSTIDGRIRKLFVSNGDKVSKETVLLEME